jgi:hypothetical protein
MLTIGRPVKIIRSVLHQQLSSMFNHDPEVWESDRTIALHDCTHGIISQVQYEWHGTSFPLPIKVQFNIPPQHERRFRLRGLKPENELWLWLPEDAVEVVTLIEPIPIEAAHG